MKSETHINFNFSSSPLNYFTLNFTSRLIQEKYSRFFLQTELQRLFVINILLTIIYLLFGVSSLSVQKDKLWFFGLIYLFISAFHLFISLIIWKYPNFMSYLGIFPIIAFSITVSEDFKIHQEILTNNQYVIGSFAIIIIFIEIISLPAWQIKILAFFASFNYVFIQLIEDSILILPIELFSLAIASIVYCNERIFKLLFYDNYCQAQQVAYYKVIMQNHLPNPIFSCTLSNYIGDLRSSNIDLNIDFKNNFFNEEFKIQLRQDRANQVQQTLYCLDKIEVNQHINSSKAIIDDLQNIDDQQPYKMSLKALICSKLRSYINKRNSIQENSFDKKDPESYEQQIEYFLNCPYYNQNGSKKYFNITLTYFVWQDRPTIIAILYNVNEKIRYQQIQQLEEYKNQLFSSVSHNLKTPLNNIINCLEASMDEPNKELQQKYLSISYNNSILLNFTINDILDYSSISYNNFKINLCKFDIQKLVQGVVDVLQYEAIAKKLQIEVNCIQILDTICYNDQIRIQQILFNILGNALKFTFEGKIIINIEGQEQDSNIIQIKIMDTGIGITEELQNSICQLFSGVPIGEENKIFNKRSGVGFGLSISKHLLQFVGPQQQISIESKEGKGTTVQFLIYKTKIQIDSDLPLDSPNQDGNQINTCSNTHRQLINNEIDLLIHQQNKQTNSKILFESVHYKDETNLDANDQEPSLDKNLVTSLTKTKTQKRLSLMNSLKTFLEQSTMCKSQLSRNSLKSNINDIKVLIVDDNSFNILSLKIVLQRVGFFYFDEAHNGLEAINKFDEQIGKGNQPYQIIFMDVNMPIMDGLEAISILKEKMKQMKIQSVKIISCTSYTQNNDRNQCFKAGADEYLKKPIKYEEMLDVLTKLKII